MNQESENWANFIPFDPEAFAAMAVIIALLILGGVILLPAILARRKLGDRDLVQRMKRSEYEAQTRHIWFS